MSLVSFYQLVPGGVSPCRGSKDVQGTLPVAALRHCKPVQEANTFGYDIFLPLDIGLRWDGGGTIEWSYDIDGTGVGAEWYPLLPQCHYPGFADYWAEHAPENLRLDVPPFLNVTEEWGNVQVWPGVIARTREDWSLLIRGPVNDSRRSMAYDVMEGIIATDRFGGPVFTNVQFAKTDAEIYIPAHRPFMRVIPVYRPHYDDRLLSDFEVGGFEDVPPERWQSYGEWSSRIVSPQRHGEYISAEKRRWAGKDK